MVLSLGYYIIYKIYFTQIYKSLESLRNIYVFKFFARDYARDSSFL